MLSKALYVSRSTTSDICFLSIFLRHVEQRGVSVECNFLFPLYKLDIFLYLSRKSSTLRVSSPLAYLWCRAIRGKGGWYRTSVFGSSESLDLRFGVTSADFDACAKQFNVNKGLIRLVMTVFRHSSRYSIMPWHFVRWNHAWQSFQCPVPSQHESQIYSHCGDRLLLAPLAWLTLLRSHTVRIEPWL